MQKKGQRTTAKAAIRQRAPNSRLDQTAATAMQQQCNSNATAMQP
jgi:hypothetical protein